MAGARNQDGSSPHPVVRTHYEDDSDDDININNNTPENAPLITPTTTTTTTTTNTTEQNGRLHSGLYRTGHGSDHSLHTLHQKQPGRRHGHRHEDELPSRTWTEWAVKNGIHPSTWTKHTYFRAFLLTLLLTLVVLAFTVFRVQDHIKDILHYIDDHRNVGAVLFVAFYTVACWLFLPGSLFTIGAGFLFKPMPFALAIVLLGDMFGAMGSFLFGRYLFYDWVKGMMVKHPKFNALDQVIRDDGWKIVVMLRLTPIPFNLITYFFSITSIKFHTLVWATVLGVFPGSCLGIWIGSLLKGLSGIDNPDLEPKNIVILGMNIVFIVCSILTLSIFGKKSLRNAMGKLDRHHEEEGEEAQDDNDNSDDPSQLRRLLDEEDNDNDRNSDLENPTRQSQTHRAVLPDGDAVVNTADMEAATSSSSSQSTSIDSTGFTRGERFTFVAIAIAVVVNVSVCIPLYHHFANQDQ